MRPETLDVETGRAELTWSDADGTQIKLHGPGDVPDATWIRGNVLGANAVFMDAFYTDVRPALAEWRASRGLAQGAQLLGQVIEEQGGIGGMLGSLGIGHPADAAEEYEDLDGGRSRA